MNKQLIGELKQRYELVQRRLTALDKEKDSLEDELEGLKTLMDVYGSPGWYDTIEEERRVRKPRLVRHHRGGETCNESLVDGKPEPFKKRKGRIPGKSMYDDAIRLVLEDTHGQQITLNKITERVSDLMGTQIRAGSILGRMNKLVDDDEVIRIEDQNGRGVGYIYVGKVQVQDET